MHVDLIEALRCPNPHADGWLVASADLVQDRRIVHGTIGCPTCGADWRVVHGSLRLTERGGDAIAATRQLNHAAAVDAALPSPALPSPALPSPALPRAARLLELADTPTEALRSQALPGEALRTAALLDLREPHGVVVLCGEMARVADALVELTGVLVLIVNPPDGVALRHSRLHVERALPLGVGCARGIVSDEAHASWLSSAVRSVARHGRVIAPVTAVVPDGATELARDARQWVAEVREVASGLVPLRRGGDPMA